MDEHIAYYNRMLGRDPTNIDARLGLAAVWRTQGQINRAVAQYAAAARMLAKRGLLLEAIAACKAIFELDPSHTETQLFLAGLYARRPAGETVAQVIAAIQPPDGDDPFDDSAELDSLIGLEESSEQELIVLNNEDRVNELDDLEFVALEPSSQDTPVEMGADQRSYADDAEPLDDFDDYIVADDAQTVEFSTLRRTTATPISVEHESITPLNYPYRDEPSPFADVVAAEHLSRSEATDTEPRMKARTEKNNDTTRALTYPDRVLRRALNLSRSTGTNRADLDAPTAHGPRPQPVRKDVYNKSTVVAEVKDLAEASSSSSTRVVRDPGLIAPALQASTTRVISGQHSRPTVVGPAPASAPLESSDPSYGSGQVEVISPAALSVSRADLPDTPLFSSLTPRTFVQLLKQIDLRRVPAGQPIIGPTDRCRGLFIIVNGEVEVVRVQPDGSHRFLATMQRGDFFGEFELLTGQSHSSVVRAKTGVDLLLLSEKVIVDLSAQDPEIWEVLWDFYHQRLLNNMLTGSSVFGHLSPAERGRLAGEFRLVERRSGQTIMRQGGVGAGLYLVLSGDVEVLMEEEGSTRKIARLGGGEFFGTVSAVTDSPAIATVVARSEATLLFLTREKLRSLAAHNHGVRQALDELVAERRMLTGTTSYSESGVNQIIPRD